MKRLGRMRGVLGVVALAVLATVACGQSRGDAAMSPPDDAPVAGQSSSAGVASSGGAGQGGTPTAVSGAGGSVMVPPQGEAGMGGEAPVVGNPVAPTYPGYTLVIDEHFDEPLDLNTDLLWTWSDGGKYFGQVRYVEDAISFSDGVMKLTTNQPNEPTAESASFAENTSVKSMPFTSGELRTKFNNYRYGRYEARIKAPIPVPGSRQQGNFITSFFTSRTPLQEDYREITAEITGGRPDGLLTNVVFWPGGIDDSSSSSSKNYAVVADLDDGFDSGDFHTYAFVWRAKSVSWYLDDELMAIRDYTFNAADSYGTPIPELPAKIMLSTWIFNGSYAYGGELGEYNVYPFTTEVDFIRFYKQDDEPYPCSEPPGCLAPEDLNASKNNPKETDTEG